MVAGLCGVQASTWQRLFTTVDGLQSNQGRQIVELPNGQMRGATGGAFSLYNGREFVGQSCNLDSVFTLPVFGGHSCFWGRATRCFGLRTFIPYISTMRGCAGSVMTMRTG